MWVTIYACSIWCVFTREGSLNVRKKLRQTAVFNLINNLGFFLAAYLDVLPLSKIQEKKYVTRDPHDNWGTIF
jgi:hypothetical protein